MKEWRDPFNGRFSFDNHLDIVDKDTLTNDFCSIIINKKNKKKILKQLEQIGIDKSFVYPELEHLAEKIKNMYV